MFIYRPHLHQLDGTITPDLIVDAAHHASTGMPVLLSDAVHASGPTSAAVAGCVVIGAGYGALLAPAVLLVAPTGAVTRCHLARQAWRLADVQDHLAALALSALTLLADVVQLGFQARVTSAEQFVLLCGLCCLSSDLLG